MSISISAIRVAFQARCIWCAFGGPLFNLIVAGVCASLAAIISAELWLALMSSLVSTNLFFGLGGLLPLPSVDGEVIWRELRRLMRNRLHTSAKLTTKPAICDEETREQ